ncbi:MAG: HK97 gp10 family phage protein [Variovorax sp.]|nr:HK97 gp10 family phage protein [Variovorax sp.]|tara:strand:+ start:217 stop:648 length:432 start_codon:yes stop_codon:yes gene_type:complete
MARTVTIEVKGLRELGERLQAMGEEMATKIARSATGAAAGKVKAAAQLKAPKRTGNLARNIITKRLGKSQTSMTSEHIVTVRRKRTAGQKKSGEQSAYYGQFVEFGSIHNVPQPFLRPAFDENVQGAIDTMKSVIASRITRGK